MNFNYYSRLENSIQNLDKLMDVESREREKDLIKIHFICCVDDFLSLVHYILKRRGNRKIQCFNDQILLKEGMNEGLYNAEDFKILKACLELKNNIVHEQKLRDLHVDIEVNKANTSANKLITAISNLRDSFKRIAENILCKELGTSSFDIKMG